MNIGESNTIACIQLFAKTILANFNNFFKYIIKIILKLTNIKISLLLIIIKLKNKLKKSKEKLGFNGIKFIFKDIFKIIINKIIKLKNILEKINMIIGLPLIYFIKTVLFLRFTKFIILNKQFIINSSFVEYLDFKNELSIFLNNFSLDLKNFLNIINNNIFAYLVVLSIVSVIICLIILTFFNILLPLKYYLLKYFENKFSNLEEKYLSINLMLNLTKILKFSISIISYIVSYIVAWEFINIVWNNVPLYSIGLQPRPQTPDPYPVPTVPPNTPETTRNFKFKLAGSLNKWCLMTPIPQPPEIIRNLPYWEDDPKNRYLTRKIEFFRWVDLDQESRVTYLRQRFYRVGLDENLHPLTVVKMSNTIARYEFTHSGYTHNDLMKYIDSQINTCRLLDRENLLKTHSFERYKPFLIHKKYELKFPNVYFSRNRIISYQTEFLM